MACSPPWVSFLVAKRFNVSQSGWGTVCNRAARYWKKRTFKCLLALWRILQYEKMQEFSTDDLNSTLGYSALLSSFLSSINLHWSHLFLWRTIFVCNWEIFLLSELHITGKSSILYCANPVCKHIFNGIWVLVQLPAGRCSGLKSSVSSDMFSSRIALRLTSSTHQL